MLRARLLILLASVLMLGGVAGTASSDTGAPTGLHAFLLRADEPVRTSFTRTPAFAWTPVAGALHYEFQLSLSTTFRDNSVVWASSNVPTPVIAPDLTLPWITGNPHSLYARVRAVLATGVTPWSDGFGFDMVPPAPPTPLPSYPGLIRWTPIEGATAYQIWLLDAKKMEIVTTNVLDEREFYIFHETQQWMGSVRWRIRVLRTDNSASGRLNTIPAVQFGPWSQTYVSTNPAFSGGPLQLVGTVSDVFSNGSANSPAHKLMPAFLFTGNTGLNGQPSELFRVEVFTDKQCLNRVFTGAVTGAPAYAPRPFGPLALPTSAPGVASARAAFLPDGAEPAGLTVDGDSLDTTESAPDAAPTGSAPPAPGDTPASPGSTGGGSSSSSSSSSSAPSGSAAPANSGLTGGTITWSGRPGAPIDLWDVDWPTSGYYWTVIPVSATPPDALSTAVLPPGAKAADTVLPVANSHGFDVGDVVQIGAGPNTETKSIVAVSGTQLTLASALTFQHGAGEPVVRTSGNFQYHDLELPQDACASGRVARFGKEGEPSLTASGDLFATGLSSTGRLTSALHTTAFYGQPLVSWTPALGATAYEVQWSKTRYPFQPQPIPGSGNLGYMTTGTSLVLPVGPGTWYYRVRGFDYSLPSGSQQMSWSDPAKLVVAKPTYKIVGGGQAKKPGAPKKPTAPAVGLKPINGTGFSIKLPTTWKPCTQGGGNLLSYCDATKAIDVSVQDDVGLTYQQYAALVATTLKNQGFANVQTKDVSLPAGPAVALTATRTVNGHVVHELGYFVQGPGNSSWLLAFDAKDGSYLKNLKLLGQIVSSFKLR
ncbi:MAG TPA: hypothetical protein VIK66_06725 [Gaiellaceae bacterium]